MNIYAILTCIIEAILWGLIIYFYFGKFKRNELRKHKFTNLILVINLFSFFIILGHFYFEIHGIIPKLIYPVRGIGIWFFTISFFLIFRNSIKEKGNKVVSIYMISLSSFIILFNLILVFIYPIFYFFKYYFLLEMLFVPSPSIEEINGRIFIDGGSLYASGKTEILDHGWYYEKGEFYYMNELKKIEKGIILHK